MQEYCKTWKKNSSSRRSRSNFKHLTTSNSKRWGRWCYRWRSDLAKNHKKIEYLFHIKSASYLALFFFYLNFMWNYLEPYFRKVISILWEGNLGILRWKWLRPYRISKIISSSWILESYELEVTQNLPSLILTNSKQTEIPFMEMHIPNILFIYLSMFLNV
jgi:hypothetical protein